MDEHVLVIPDLHFAAVGAFVGFRVADAEYARRLLDAAQYSFRPRSEVEDDPSFKQLIPYVVLVHDDLVFHYRRGSKGTETRLAALRSVGIGGHISAADAAGNGDPYANGLARELAEEVESAPVLDSELLGLIYDPRTPVGRVHLGIVHRFVLETPRAVIRDAALTEAGFATLPDLLASNREFESWSQLTLELLAKKQPRRDRGGVVI